MRVQWTLILALVFALVVAIFAILNVTPVTIDYGFGIIEISLILIILLSALFGGITVGFYGIYRQYRLQRQIHRIQRERNELQLELEQYKQKEALAEEGKDMKKEEEDVTVKDTLGDPTSR